MRIKISPDCNVCTDEHSNAYQTPDRGPAPEITIPSLRARLSIHEAEALAQSLAAAVARAKKEHAVARAKQEILFDIKQGVVPATVRSFSELHDYVDANGYGGAFEGDADDIDIDFWNAVQDEVHAWLQRGRK